MDKNYRGNASQFFIAGELCRRGYSAVVTLGNTPNTDILCSKELIYCSTRDVNNAQIFIDDDHLTIYGSKKLTNLLLVKFSPQNEPKKNLV